MGDRISIPIPEDLRFVPKEFLKEWIDGGFIESKQCLKIWGRVQYLVQDESQVGLYLAGPMGVGKSAIMYYVVHKARQLGWFLVYIPRCDDWLSQSLGSPADWYAYYFDAVLAGLQMKQDVEVILAFDEVQALFGNGVNIIRTQKPFSIIDWGMNYKRGCIFVTGSADSPYCLQLLSGHEQFVSHVCGLTDDEVRSWFQTPQFANIAQHPTLLTLGKDFGDLKSGLRNIIEQYSVSRRSLYLYRFYEFEVNHFELVQRALNSVVKLFVQVHIRRSQTFPVFALKQTKLSWKYYAPGTLVAHRLDFVFFGGKDCVIFFELTVAADLFKFEYSNLNNSDRLELILNSVSKWMGCKMRVSEDKHTLELVLQIRGSSEGSVEYIVHLRVHYLMVN
ncbi:hypothetical protein MIR68_004092 [Amoeboaphelidium protococcarum]|nr:hypothetical protein MIR68_004092 [Amoeboaphelidium protococcarum]